MTTIADLSQLDTGTEFLRDDCTSCTSSITTSGTIGATDDPDELHLGAEANSFDKEKVSTSPTSRTKSSQYPRYCTDSLIIMRQVYCSMENLKTDVKYSAISSVEDILNARECDPDDILTSLGFANCFDEMNKRDILSRFKASPLLNNKDNQFLDAMLSNSVENNHHKRPQYKDSIHKAEEWLALHHNDNNKEKINFNKASPGPTANTPSKKSSVNRSAKWKRFPKSRQSSFELLLPNVTEEDNQSDALAARKRDQAASPNHPTIRESSFELPIENDRLQPTLRINKNELNAMQKNTYETPYILCYCLLRHADYPRIFYVVNGHKQTISPSGLPSIIRFTEETDQRLPIQLHITQEKEPTYKNIAETNDEDRKLSRLLKSSLLITSQRDSFELEEINSFSSCSCNGEAVETTKQRRPGVAFLTIDSCKRNGGLQSHSPNSDGGSDENESSSGFGEDDVLNSTNHVQPNQSRHNVAPHTVVESVQKKRGIGSSVHSSTVSTHYVYDVELGNDQRKDETMHVDGGSSNSNNNARGATINERCFEANRRRSKSSSALLTNYVPLRTSESWHGFGKLRNGFVVTPLSHATDIYSKSDETGIGKSRSFYSDARRRRKEFAERSALSGDSIADMVSTALIRHNGNLALKKRRPGHFRYYTSSNDLFSKQSVRNTNDFQRMNSSGSNCQLSSSTCSSSSLTNLPTCLVTQSDRHQSPTKNYVPPEKLSTSDAKFTHSTFSSSQKHQPAVDAVKFNKVDNCK